MKRFEIIATFANGETARYTSAVLNDLVSDSFITQIVDAETGELIYDSDHPVYYIEWCAARLVGVRSAWQCGVGRYINELCEMLDEGITGGWWFADDLQSPAVLRKMLLNGAADWKGYSEGGCSLIYNGDIAERLCNQTELKKTDGGRKAPNARETWLDVQARALYQAARYIEEAARVGCVG